MKTPKPLNVGKSSFGATIKGDKPETFGPTALADLPHPAGGEKAIKTSLMSRGKGPPKGAPRRLQSFFQKGTKL